MKRFLLPETGNFYKVNMHCHTTVSDGTQTPEEVKKFYKDKGYSAVAFTLRKRAARRRRFYVFTRPQTL